MTETTAAHPTLVIAFQGLMHFQTGNNAYKHVAVVDALDFYCPHKDPKIYIWRDGQHGDDIPLDKDDVVTFNVAPGQLYKDSLYRRHVPMLRDFILLGDVDTKVARQLPANGVLAYVTLPPGRLTTWSTFKNPAELFNNRGRRETKCFARFVVLETRIASDVYMTVHHARSSKDYLLKPTDVLFVSNIKPTSGTDYHPHFPAYGRLLTKYGQVSPARIRDDIDCDTSEGVGQFTDEVEYALDKNSNPAPNGDCGPTGP